MSNVTLLVMIFFNRGVREGRRSLTRIVGPALVGDTEAAGRTPHGRFIVAY